MTDRYSRFFEHNYPSPLMIWQSQYTGSKPPEPKTWKCEYCGRKNKRDDDRCAGCGAPEGGS